MNGVALRTNCGWVGVGIDLWTCVSGPWSDSRVLISASLRSAFSRAVTPARAAARCGRGDPPGDGGGDGGGGPAGAEGGAGGMGCVVGATEAAVYWYCFMAAILLRAIASARRILRVMPKSRAVTTCRDLR